MEKRVTKRDYFNAILKEIEGKETFGGFASDEMVDFITKQIEQLDKKAASAKKNAEKKKADGDELREVVLSVLTTELQSIDTVVSQIEGEDITRAKVQARLSQLVKMGAAIKDDMEDGKRKVKGYKLAVSVEAAEEEQFHKKNEKPFDFSFFLCYNNNRKIINKGVVK